MQPIITLASASPRRSELLTRLGVTFEVRPAQVDECEDAKGNPQAIAVHNARIKGEWVEQHHGSQWVLSADTLVCLGERIFNKPVDMADAREMLRTLSGNTHYVYTGVYLRTPMGLTVHCERTAVTFASLNDAAIDAYFKIVNPLDKSGAYAIQQGLGSVVSGYSGSITNVMGLPIEFLCATFPEYGIPIASDVA